MFDQMLALATWRNWLSDAERDEHDWLVLPPSMREGRLRRYQRNAVSSAP
jgi:hypothetical protein